jgi:hypothetical protein
MAPPGISERLGLLHHDFIDVAPHPILTRLERTYHRVLGGVKVLRGVLILRGVAAADVPAGQAKTQMNPAIAGFQAFFATLGARRDFVDLLQMSASCHWYLCGSSPA